MEAFYVVAFLVVIIIQQYDKYLSNQFYSSIVKDLSSKVISRDPVEYHEYQAPESPIPEPLTAEDEESKKWQQV